MSPKLNQMLDVILAVEGGRKNTLAEQLMLAGGIEKRYAAAKAKLLEL